MISDILFIVIKVDAITKVYGKKENSFKALDNISFDIPDGETVAIIGKSGSGKSTLMHIMSGLDHPTTGKIHIGDRCLQDMKQKQIDTFRANEMSFIFQSFFVEANQTVYQNVMLPLEIGKVGRRIRKNKVLAALESVELSDKINSKAANLSGGQKQRLAIARSIVNKPQLIFADEPTGNLDSATGDLIIKLLFSLNKELGCTLVIVTHDDELASKCNMRVQLKDGKIVSIDKKRTSSLKRPAKKPSRKVI